MNTHNMVSRKNQKENSYLKLLQFNYRELLPFYRQIRQQQIDNIFFLTSQKIDFDTSCKLPPNRRQSA